MEASRAPGCDPTPKPPGKQELLNPRRCQTLWEVTKTLLGQFKPREVHFQALQDLCDLISRSWNLSAKIIQKSLFHIPVTVQTPSNSAPPKAASQKRVFYE